MSNVEPVIEDPIFDESALETAFQARDPEIVLPPDPDDDPDLDDEPDPAAVLPPADATPDAEPTDAELAAQWREYQQWLTDNPQVAQGIAQLAQTGNLPQVDPAAFTPPSPAPEPDPAPTLTPDDLGLDMDDPVHRNLWGLIQGQNALIGQIGERLQNTESQLTSRQQQEYQALTNRAVASYKDQRGLTDAEITELRGIASNLEVLPSLLKGVDPVTGAPIPVDALTAVERALDIAYWSTDKFREREFARQVQDRAKDQRRKQKAGSLAGSSGSMPKGAADRKPANESEMRQMVAAGLAEYMNQATE